MICHFDVSLDGLTFIPCEQNIMIYEKAIAVTSVNPKCGSLQGEIELKFQLVCDEKIMKYVTHLLVGFHPQE